MHRKLDPRFKWKPESVELEILDWKNNQEDFQRLSDFVRNRLNNKLAGKVSLEELLTSDQFDKEIRRLAALFSERFVSLPFFVYLNMKEVVSVELRKRDLGRKKHVD